MITILIRTEDEGGGRIVHGVVYLTYDPAAMDVLASYPRPETPSQLAYERVPLIVRVRNLKRRHGIPAQEVLACLRSSEGHVLQTDPLRRPERPASHPAARPAARP